MGKPMASNLQKAGHDIFLSDHFNEAPADLCSGRNSLSFPGGSGRSGGCHYPNGAKHTQVEDVLFGNNGVEQGLAAGGATGKLVIDMSSISPIATKAIAARVNEGGFYQMHRYRVVK